VKQVISSEKIVYISWAPYCSRSDNTARELGGQSYMVYYGFLGSHYCTIALKYFLQTLETLYILLRDRPKIVFVMSPPVFAAVPVYVYCAIFNSCYAIDAHTGAFDNPMWNKVLFLQQFLCKKARLSIVTNGVLANILESWGARALVIPDVPIQCLTSGRLDLRGRGHIVTLVNSFAKDEPLEEFLEATQALPGERFFVTGKQPKKRQDHLDLGYKNVQFTGFLPEKDYAGLLKASDLIVVLTTRDNTMQRGAYEAIYYGKPVVTSNWGVLRENFPQGAIFVDNSAMGIAEGIRSALSRLEKLRVEAEKLKELKLIAFEEHKKELLSCLLPDQPWVSSAGD